LPISPGTAEASLQMSWPLPMATPTRPGSALPAMVALDGQLSSDRSFHQSKQENRVHHFQRLSRQLQRAHLDSTTIAPSPRPSPPRRGRGRLSLRARAVGGSPSPPPRGRGSG